MAKSIDSEDLSLAKVYQSFYSVPDYQREYVWGEKDANADGGEQIDHFLQDILSEFDNATADEATEYFIGTIVVWEPKEGNFDLIDGQQRLTTSFLVLCALRDAFIDAKADVPPTLADQISSSSMDWRGETQHRMRLVLQYDDACGVLEQYGAGRTLTAAPQETRSIRNIANAYQTIRLFLRSNFGEDVKQMLRFYGYFSNKVKLIRIQTPDVSRALKIFETINDRGAALDGMDLLKNLLFMRAKEGQYAKLKADWKELTQNLFDVSEKPLRFLRYYILANFEVKDSKLREEDIYGWLAKASAQTGHAEDPLGFAAQLKSAAQSYANFAKCKNPRGIIEEGLFNTRALGGSAIKQHFMLLLAGRHLDPTLFTRLCNNVEDVMCIWLFAGVPTKSYERTIISATRALRTVKTEEDFSNFEANFFHAEKRAHLPDFVAALKELAIWHVRQFRMKYFLAKVAQYIDVQAYGLQGHESLASYLLPGNNIEHILSQEASATAIEEFGEGAQDEAYIQCLGNLMLLEKSVNIVASNAPYSVKCSIYPSSKFLLSRCQAAPLQVGSNDRITRTMKRMDTAPIWNREAINKRQNWFADAALDVWHLRTALQKGDGGISSEDALRG